MDLVPLIVVIRIFLLGPFSSTFSAKLLTTNVSSEPASNKANVFTNFPLASMVTGTIGRRTADEDEPAVEPLKCSSVSSVSFSLVGSFAFVANEARPPVAPDLGNILGAPCSIG